jgi:hypothetical protein
MSDVGAGDAAILVSGAPGRGSGSSVGVRSGFGEYGVSGQGEEELAELAAFATAPDGEMAAIGMCGGRGRRGRASRR